MTYNWLFSHLFYSHGPKTLLGKEKNYSYKCLERKTVMLRVHTFPHHRMPKQKKTYIHIFHFFLVNNSQQQQQQHPRQALRASRQQTEGGGEQTCSRCVKVIEAHTQYSWC